MLDSLPGSAGSRCVDVADQTTLRSGDLAMGDFVQARKEFRSRGRSDDGLYFFVIPQHANTGNGATVTASSAGSATRKFHSTGSSTANDWRYYPVTVDVNAPGTWTFKVRSGTDAGCFTARFASG